MWGPSEWRHNTSENLITIPHDFLIEKAFWKIYFILALGLSSYKWFPFIYRRLLLSLFTDIMGTKYNGDPRKKVTILPRFLTRMIETKNYKL